LTEKLESPLRHEIDVHEAVLRTALPGGMRCADSAL